MSRVLDKFLLFLSGVADTVVDHAADRADEDGGPCAHKEHRHGLCTGHEAGPAIAQGGQQLCTEAGAGGGQVSTSFRVI